MKKILFVFAHPHPKKSRANRAILERVKSLPNITVDDLYEKYPFFDVNVKAEQKLLLEHDVIVLQQPFYWYGMPPLLKEWIDVVWEFGFAYGEGGTSLRGKEFQLSITAGGPHEAYRTDGYNNYPIEAFLPPYIQTARLCGMKWLEPLIFHNAIRSSQEDISIHAEVVRKRLAQI